MERDFEYIISKNQTGQRIDHFLALQKEVGLTRSQIQKLIEEGYVEVNKEVPRPSYKLKLDDRIILSVPPPKKMEVLPENIPLEIIHEDADLIVVNKPRGMAVHPAAGNYSGTLVNALLYHCRDLSGIGGVLRPGIVHRLDKNTSGVMVIAQNDFAHRSLAKQFKQRKVIKRYVALVHGVIKQDEGEIKSRIGRHPRHRKKMAVIGPESRIKGREAVSQFRVLERFKNYTLVEVTLRTGRTHQIRVHLTFIGHPVVGDPTYGHRREKFKTAGQLLHAEVLGFEHPRSGEYVEYKANLPEDVKEVLRKLQVK